MIEQLDSHFFTATNKKEIARIVSNYFGNEHLDDLLESCSVISIQKGEILLKEGESGDSMYVLLSGSMQASLSSDEGIKALGTIKAGQSVGEMALLGKQRRSATVTAMRNSILLKIEKLKFDQIVETNHSMLLHLSSILINRLDKANRGEKSKKSKSQFIALDCSLWRENAEEVAEQIRRYWGDTKNIELLTEENHGELNQVDFMLKVYELEACDYVFLINGKSQAWNNQVKDNADKTIYCAREEAVERMKASILSKEDELLLCYENGQEPSNVQLWFDLFDPNQIFRIRAQLKADQDRMVRIICEEQICLVFGGGGAHGLCNLGVVKALNELEIPIDVIGGTSVGSIFSGALALDFDYDTMYKNVDHDMSKNNPLKDYTFPFVALLKGAKMRKMLARHFSIPIEHSWKNFFAVAANLSASRTEVIQSGFMNQAVAASISIPGILPPSLFRKSLLIDGGVLNNLPTDIMADLYKGHIISVDVVSSKTRTIEHQYSLGNWQFLKNVLTGSRKNYVPSTMGTLMKAMTLASAEKADEKEKLSDLYIKPRVKKGFLAWKAIKVFEEEGYKITKSLVTNLDYRGLLQLPK